MADFDTELKTAPLPLETGEDASVAICEDNLAALLRVMNGAAAPEPAASEPVAAEPIGIPSEEVWNPPSAESLSVNDAAAPPDIPREPEQAAPPEPAPPAVLENAAISSTAPGARTSVGSVSDAVRDQDSFARNFLFAEKVVVVEDAVAGQRVVPDTVVIVEPEISGEKTIVEETVVQETVVEETTAQEVVAGQAVSADKSATTETDPVGENRFDVENPAAAAAPPEAESAHAPAARLQQPPVILTDPQPLAEASPAPLIRDATPSAAEALPKVASQLALLSSIKQRRTMTGRSEPVKLPVLEPEKPAASAALEAPVTPVEAPPPPKASAPAKKKKPERAEFSILLPIPDPAEEKPEPPRANTYLDRISEPPKPAPVWTPPSHTGPGLDTVVTSTYTGSYRGTVKQKSFAASGTGIVLIGGTVLALGVTAYLLLGFDFKPKQAPLAPQPVIEETVAPTKSTSQRASGERLRVEKSPASAAAPIAVDRKRDEKEMPSPALLQAPRADTAQKTDTVQTVAVGNSVSIVARTFTPPAAGARSAENPILEAPPALATSQAAPPVGTLAGGMAPLLPPSAPANAATGLRQINVAGKVQASKMIKQVKPAYPALARATRLQGTVRFRATIGTDGQIKNLTSLSGPPPLVQPAADAVKQWRYQPTLVNGEAVEVVTEIDVAFTL